MLSLDENRGCPSSGASWCNCCERSLIRASSTWSAQQALIALRTTSWLGNGVLSASDHALYPSANRSAHDTQKIGVFETGMLVTADAHRPIRSPATGSRTTVQPVRD